MIKSPEAKERKRQRDREYYAKNKESIKARIKEYYKTNKDYRERCKQSSRTHFEQNKDAAKAYQERYWVDNAEKIRAQRQEHYPRLKRNKPWLLHYRSARERCHNPNHIGYHRYGGRGIEFHLTKKEVRMMYERDGGKDMEHPSIDRVDNDGNYCLENCRFIEWVDNVRKGGGEANVEN